VNINLRKFEKGLFESKIIPTVMIILAIILNKNSPFFGACHSTSSAWA
jgi:hypothetical protein